MDFEVVADLAVGCGFLLLFFEALDERSVVFLSQERMVSSERHGAVSESSGNYAKYIIIVADEDCCY